MTKVKIPIIALLSLHFMQIPIANGKNANSFNHNINSTSNARSVKFVENELLYLSELPLEKLLQVEKSLQELKHICEYSGPTEDSLLSSRMLDDEVGFRPDLQKKAITLVDEKKINR